MSEYADRGIKFGNMPLRQKFTWTLKLFAALLTFGFAFPNVMHE